MGVPGVQEELPDAFPCLLRVPDNPWEAITDYLQQSIKSRLCRCDSQAEHLKEAHKVFQLQGLAGECARHIRGAFRCCLLVAIGIKQDIEGRNTMISKRPLW